MVEIEFCDELDQIPVKDLVHTEIIEFAEEAKLISLKLELTAPSAESLFPIGKVDPDRTEDLKFVKQYINGRKNDVDIFDEEVFLLLNEGYSGLVDDNSCELVNSFENIQEANSEAVLIENTLSTLEGSVNVRIKGLSEEAIERLSNVSRTDSESGLTPQSTSRTILDCLTTMLSVKSS